VQKEFVHINGFHQIIKLKLWKIFNLKTGKNGKKDLQKHLDNITIYVIMNFKTVLWRCLYEYSY